MTTQSFVVTHAKDAQFERGLRSFFEYRDLGLKQATQGRVTASVIRAAGGHAFSSQPHLHHTEFQLVYVLKGWIEFEYEGQGVVRLALPEESQSRRFGVMWLRSSARLPLIHKLVECARTVVRQRGGPRAAARAATRSP